jgi:hypothetical protein
VRTIAKLEAVDPGFRAKGLTLFGVSLPAAAYPVPKDIATLHRIEEAVAALPGVERATATSIPLVAGWQSSGSFYVEGAPLPAKDTPDDWAKYARVGGDFFPTMSIPVLAGRALNDHDTESAIRRTQRSGPRSSGSARTATIRP